MLPRAGLVGGGAHNCLRRSSAFEGGRLLSALSRWIGDEADCRSVNNPMNARFAAAQRMSLPLIRFIVLLEDKRFWNHCGLDPWSIARAAAYDLLDRGRLQGASTIPEQLVKTFGGPTGRTLQARAIRALRAMRLTKRVSHFELLRSYCENVYLGRHAYGVHAGARHYFAKQVETLSAAEAFFLAERIALPNGFRAARIRNILGRNTVVDLLRHDFAGLREVYAMSFGATAGRAVANILSVIGHDC